MFDIRQDDLSGVQTRALLTLHLSGMAAHSPPDAVHALDLSGLTAPGVSVWSVWDGDSLAAIGALRQHDAALGEIKSMRTHPDHLRRGAAALLLDHLIAEARRRGLSRLSLETGRGPAFEPAATLYRRRGFAEGDAFLDYRAGSFSRFFHLTL